MDSFNLYFMDIIKTKYALFDGRARRREYWMYQLWLFIITVALWLVFAVFSLIAGPLGMVVLVAMILVFLAIIVPSLAITVRRLHDMGQTGWWLLLNLVGLSIVPFIFTLLDSQPSENKYGPNPKALPEP
ncbi:MAG: DUF805 domain-containing protein [Deltaproteobacteria bacterium]|jgi:uncharacterized membrane protein YhaH (DUF805 family)|nr:DUF805 domain-containing protein [Deltaproteobacteria bacterium]